MKKATTLPGLPGHPPAENRPTFRAMPAPVTGPAAPQARPAIPQPFQVTPEQARRLDRRQAWMNGVRARQQAFATRAPAIARRPDLSGDDFLNDHYVPMVPVAVPGAAAGWPAARWTPERLVELVGDVPVTFQGSRIGDPEFELMKDAHRRTMPFPAFMASILSTDGNESYLTAYNSADNRDALAPLERDLGHLGRYLTRAHGMPWIGPRGTFTPLHHDLTNNLLIQLVGRKRLLLVSPAATPFLANERHVFSEVHDLESEAHLARHPQARGVIRHEVVLEPGDALFIPVGWWHQVSSLDFSVMYTCTNFRWPNDAHSTFPTS